jgi:predicted nucleic acid-binding protein
VASPYVETSALLKRYVRERESEDCQMISDAHPHRITSRITITETLINLRKRLSTAEFAIVSKLFQSDVNVFDVVEFDAELSFRAIEVAAGNSLATLDAIHLASALRVKSPQLAFLAYDRRLAISAKKSGLRVLGL